jgi:hypothetical protein
MKNKSAGREKEDTVMKDRDAKAFQIVALRNDLK